MVVFNPLARRALLCGLLAFALALAADSADLLRTLERYSWDARVTLLARPGVATDEIRLIELDQNSLDWGSQENGLQWPWPREVYGVILDFCRRAGAATVSFDVIFSEPSMYGVEDDQALAEAGKANGRLLLSFVVGESTGASAAWPPGLEEAGGFSAGAAPDWKISPALFFNAPRASFPTPEVMAGAAALGVVNQDPDPDGTFRALRPLVFFDGRPAPMLSLAAYLLHASDGVVSGGAGELTVSAPGRSDVVIPLDEQGRAILNFRGGTGTHVGYSAAAVIQSELRLREGQEPVIRPEELRGKHVLFGFTAPALLDLRPAPPGGVFTGLELHATALDNLLSNDFFRPAPAWLTVPLMAALCLAAAFFALRAVNMRQLALVAVISLSLPLGLAWGAYRLMYWLPVVPLAVAVGVSLALAVMVAYSTEGRQRRFLKNAFSQYLSPEVINQIIKEPGRLKLGGERRELSIYFSDLAGFSSISEHLSPEELTRLLNEYLSAMTDIILEEGGTIDKYEGDAIIAFWNAPQEQPDHAARALRAAVRCQETLAAKRAHFRKTAGRDMTMRIGLNTGPAVVGNMGSRSRFDYTMLGDAVNLASRLEGANKVYGTGIMASEAVFKAAGAVFANRELGLLQVVGRKEPTRVLEPMRYEVAAERAEMLDIFAQGLAAFKAGRLDEAKEYFARIAAVDSPAAAYLKRCSEMAEPLPPDWAGVWKLTEK